MTTKHTDIYHKIKKLGNITWGIFLDIPQFYLGYIQSRDASRAITHAEKCLMDYKRCYYELPRGMKIGLKDQRGPEIELGKNVVFY